MYFSETLLLHSYNKSAFILEYKLLNYFPMHKCCISTQIRKNQRRIHGLQLPLNCQQVICWIVFILTAGINFIVLIPIQFEELKILSFVVYITLYASHIVAHVTALLLDPSEKDLRIKDINTVPEFDRTIHAHVIENGRCHLCNINTSDKRTKHCGICNKCIYRFDHHCMWLNNCVGKRNYTAFIICVCTALILALYTTSLCITDIVFFFHSPERLSTVTQRFINCTTVIDGILSVMYCRNSIIFVIFLILFCICGVSIGCALLHLLCFHIYISVLGLSTYEYIVQNTNETSYKSHFCRNKMRNMYLINFNKDERSNGNNKHINKGKSDVSHLISVLVQTELGKARQIFLRDNNKIHPSPNDIS